MAAKSSDKRGAVLAAKRGMSAGAQRAATTRASNAQLSGGTPGKKGPKKKVGLLLAQLAYHSDFSVLDCIHVLVLRVMAHQNADRIVVQKE